MAGRFHREFQLPVRHLLQLDHGRVRGQLECASEKLGADRQLSAATVKQRG
jgi:hypothetical protein